MHSAPLSTKLRRPCGKSGEVEIQNYALEWEAYINIYIVLTVENDTWFVKIGYKQVSAGLSSAEQRSALLNSAQQGSVALTIA